MSSKTLTLRVPIPALGGVLAANAVGLLGLLAAVLAIGGLAGPWWGVLAGGLVAVGLSYIAQTHAAAPAAPQAVPTPLRKTGA
jgi:hypothetical protein